jgi:hypothetical protein
METRNVHAERRPRTPDPARPALEAVLATVLFLPEQPMVLSVILN